MILKRLTTLLLSLCICTNTFGVFALPVLAQATALENRTYTPELWLDGLKPASVENTPALLEVVTTPFPSPQMRLGDLLLGVGEKVISVDPKTGKQRTIAKIPAQALSFGAQSAAPFILTPSSLVQIGDGNQQPLGKILFEEILGKTDGSLAAVGGIPTEDGEIVVVTQDGKLLSINPTRPMGDRVHTILLEDGPQVGITSLVFIPDPSDRTLGTLWATIPTQNKVVKLTLSLVEKQIKATVSLEITDLVRPLVVRYSQSQREFWVLTAQSNLLWILDQSGTPIRQIALPAGDWNGLAIAESFNRVEELYLTRSQKGLQQVWRMPVAPLTLISPQPEGTLTGIKNQFSFSFNRALKLNTLSNENIQLLKEGTTTPISIGLQLSKADTVRVQILEPMTGRAQLKIRQGLTDIYGNSLAQERRFWIEFAPPEEPVAITPEPTSVTTGEASNAQILDDGFQARSWTAASRSEPVPANLVPITSGISITRQGSETPILFTGNSVTVRNTGNTTIPGPIYLSIEGLSRKVKVSNTTDGYALDTGAPLIAIVALGAELAPNQQITGTLIFQRLTPNATISYTTRILNGSQQDLSSQFSTSLGNQFNVPRFRQKYKVKNTSSTVLNGPLYLSAENLLPSGAKLLNATGASPISGAPLVALDLGELNQIAPNQTVDLFFQFNVSGTTYTTSLLGIPLPPNPLTPRIDTISPSELFVSQKTRVTLRGINLQEVASVSFYAGPNSSFGPTAELEGKIIYGRPDELVVEIVVQNFAQIGTRSLNVTAGSLVSNTLPFTVVAPPPTSAATSVSGKVMTGEAIPRPLAGVRVYLDQFPGLADTYTDAQGEFTLTNLPERQTTLAVDGRMVESPQGQWPYPEVIVPVSLTEGQANTLPYTVYLTATDPASQQTIPVTVTQDLTLTTNKIPNLQVVLPTGFSAKLPNGSVVDKLTITAVSPDRSPMPLPEGVAPVQLLSIQPADAILSEPVPVIYQNLYKNSRPGDQVTLYRADHETESGQFIPYGTGTVSADGRQIVPNLDPTTGKPYGLPAFSWHFPAPPTIPANQGAGDPPPEQGSPGAGGGGGCASTPCSIDLASGIETLQTSDFAVTGGRLPFALTRHYRTDDNRQGPFGPGTAHNFEMSIQEIGPQWLELVHPFNYRSRFVPKPSITGQFINEDAPQYRGAILSKESATNSYILKFKQGNVMKFGKSSTINGRANYFLTALIDRNGNQLTITREAGNNITQISSPSGSMTFVVDLISGLIQRITDQGGRSVRYIYTDGKLTSVLDPKDQAMSYTYTAEGRLFETFDRRGKLQARRLYTTAGKVYREEFADNSSLNIEYTLVNPSDLNSPVAVAKVTDPEGRIQEYRFDSGKYTNLWGDKRGKQSQVNRGLVTNRVEKVVDRLGRETLPTFDDQENLKKVQVPDGGIAEFEYEPNYNLVEQVKDPLGKISRIEYDPLGNPIKTIDPLLKETMMFYEDANNPGLVTRIRNAKQEESTLSYDARGNMISMTDALGHSVNYEYDLLNRMTRITNELDEKIEYTYDLLNRKTEVKTNDGGVVKFAYDENSNLISVTDQNNNVTTYEYDDRNRLVRKLDPSQQQETYTYDKVGNLKQKLDRRGQQTLYEYDENDRLISTSYADGSVVTANYDDNDRLESVNDSAPGAGLHSFEYDLMDRITKETNPRGSIEYGYDLLGRRKELKINNGQRLLTYDYDDNDRLTRITEGSESFNFGYDELDRRSSLTMPNGIAAEYTYDTVGRLERILYQNGSTPIRDLTYGYDELNRRISFSSNGPTRPKDSPIGSVVINERNQYTQVDGSALQQDENGNQILAPGYSGTWDARDRLVSLTSNGITASFTYDVSGRRTSKTVNGSTQTYLYDGEDIVKESGSNPADYLHGPGIDEPLVRRSSSEEFYLADALGSVIGLTDAVGSVQTSYAYSPFGKKIREGDPSDNPYGYTGREDDLTGLYFYRARYYSPDLKRFIAEDPIGFGGGDSNLQAYVGNDPVNKSDPSGNEAFSIDINISFGAIGQGSFTRSVGCDGYFNCGYVRADAQGGTSGNGNGLGVGITVYPNSDTTFTQTGFDPDFNATGTSRKGGVGGESVTLSSAVPLNVKFGPIPFDSLTVGVTNIPRTETLTGPNLTDAGFSVGLGVKLPETATIGSSTDPQVSLSYGPSEVKSFNLINLGIDILDFIFPNTKCKK